MKGFVSIEQYDRLAIALRDAETAAALTAYVSLRHALVAPDTLPVPLLAALRDRVLEAAAKYPDNGKDTPALASANVVLRAYAAYVDATIEETTTVMCGKLDVVRS